MIMNEWSESCSWIPCEFGMPIWKLSFCSRFCVIPCCIGVGKDCSLAKFSETRVKSDRIHSVRFEAALINLSERFIIIYATEMIKACRYITRIGNSIPLNDPEKQFSCFVWVAVFFQFLLAIFFPANQPCLFTPCSSPRNVPGGEERE